MKAGITYFNNHEQQVDQALTLLSNKSIDAEIAVDQGSGTPQGQADANALSQLRGSAAYMQAIKEAAIDLLSAKGTPDASPMFNIVLDHQRIGAVPGYNPTITVLDDGVVNYGVDVTPQSPDNLLFAARNLPLLGTNPEYLFRTLDIGLGLKLDPDHKLIFKTEFSYDGINRLMTSPNVYSSVDYNFFDRPSGQRGSLMLDVTTFHQGKKPTGLAITTNLHLNF